MELFQQYGYYVSFVMNSKFFEANKTLWGLFGVGRQEIAFYITKVD
jgi:hypothetical protein